MIEAFGWGLVAGSSLVLGALAAFYLRPSARTIGLVMAFGAGVLIGAVAYELVLEALESAASGLVVSSGLAVGALAFYTGDRLIERGGDAGRQRSTRTVEGAASLAIALGALLDGVPESFVVGYTLLEEQIGLSFLAAVFVSNVPESVSASAGLCNAGWTRRRILGLWSFLALASGVSAASGYAVGTLAPGLTGSFFKAFAAGAIVTMLAGTMMPEAFEQAARKWAC